MNKWKPANRTVIEDEANKGVAGDVVVTYEDARLVIKRGNKTLYDKRYPEWVDTSVSEYEEPNFEDKLSAIYRGKDAVLVEIGYRYGPHCDSRESVYVAVSLN